MNTSLGPHKDPRFIMEREAGKQTGEWRPFMLVTISAPFFRHIYLAENFHKVLWIQDVTWRRETQFNQVIERASIADALFNSEKYCFYWEHWVLKHKEWKTQESRKLWWLIVKSYRCCLLDVSAVNLYKSYLEKTAKICQVAPWSLCKVFTVPE